MALVSLEAAKSSLKLSGTDDDADLSRRLDAATAIVVRHLNDGLTTGWSEDTDPAEDESFAIVQAVILDVAGNLYADRGDSGEPSTDGPLTGRMKHTLIACGLMDPTLG